MITNTCASPEYVYAIKGECMTKYKMGRWRGSISKLMQRYTTPYGWGSECIVFQVANSVESEKILFSILRPHHWRNELFDLQAFPSFLEFGTEFCLDSVFSTDMVIKNTVYNEKQLVEKQKQESQARIDEVVAAVQEPSVQRKNKRQLAQEESRARKHIRKELDLQAIEAEEMQKQKACLKQKRTSSEELQRLAQDFIRQHVQHTSKGSDYVDKTTMYEHYKLEHPEEKRKVTALGKRNFLQQIMHCLGDDDYYEGPKRVAGPVLKRHVWLNHKFVTG